MTAFLVFLIEAGLAIALYAVGVHRYADLSVGWAALVPPGAAFAVFILMLDVDVYCAKRDDDVVGMAFSSMMLGGLVGVFAAPIVLVLTGSWLSATSMLASALGLILATCVCAVIGGELHARSPERRGID